MPESEMLRQIYEDYARTYAYRICTAMQMIDPERFRELFGSFENCVREVYDDAIQWIKKWGPNWFSGIAARVLEKPLEKPPF